MSEFHSEGVLVLDLAGRLDAEKAQKLAERLAASRDAGPHHVLLDLEHVIYIASACVRVLLVDSREIRAAGRRMVLASVPALVFEVFEINGLNREFDFATSRDEGLELLRAFDSSEGA